MKKLRDIWKLEEGLNRVRDLRQKKKIDLGLFCNSKLQKLSKVFKTNKNETNL